MPSSPPLILRSSRVKFTESAGAPALDIWFITHSPNFCDGETLSQAACALARKSLPGCHTAEAVIGVDSVCANATAAANATNRNSSDEGRSLIEILIVMAAAPAPVAEPVAAASAWEAVASG